MRRDVVLTLDRGTKLGPYEILEPIGAGGMGEVYKARDTRLGRTIAVKVCAAQFSERFEREARAIAALNHPHICALYDVGPDYLVMELIEGPTLAARIGQGALPLEEALAFATQIAEALEAAHEKGIVHRDLKPGNIKLTAEGKVKVLDFGLAKALDNDSPASADPRSSPTLTLSPTRAGMILGTAGYMSPEQARGHVVDKRADIWAFGVVLYEMLTGRLTFAGETISDTLAAVLKTDPDWSALAPETPTAIRRLLRRCLVRDRRRRLRDIGDALVEIEEARTEAPPSMPASAAKSSGLLPWAVAGALAIALAVSTVFLLRKPASVSRPLLQLNAEPAPGAVVAPHIARGGLAISPDGRRLVFRVRGADGKTRLGVRLLDQSQLTTLPGTEDANSPFFSPDGQWIAFFADGKLKKIATEGGAPVTLCDAPISVGGSWGDDGNIIACLGLTTGLSRIPSAGGVPTPVTVLSQDKGELRHSFPQVLPGSQEVLFTSYRVAGGFREPQIEVLSLRSGERKTIRGGFFGRYLPSGHLVYVHQNTLFAAPFDVRRMALTGSPKPMLAEISNAQDRGAEIDFSQTGTVVCFSGMPDSMEAIFWLASGGKLQPLVTTPGVYSSPRFSPDGKRLAFSLDDSHGNEDIWVRDLERETASRLTFLPGANQAPLWTPDSRNIIFLSEGSPAPGIYAVRADRSGEPQRLAEMQGRMLPHSISPDGKRLAGLHPFSGGLELWTASLENDGDQLRLGKPEAFLRSRFITIFPVFSPDGHWLAYASNESGTREIYVRPFPGPGGGVQVSSGGGHFPIWSRNGRELFFRGADMRLMVVEYTVRGDSFTAGKPHVWSEQPMLDLTSPPIPTYDLAPDGKRLAVILYADGTAEQKPITHVTFLLNFFDELRRRVPTGNQ